MGNPKPGRGNTSEQENTRDNGSTSTSHTEIMRAIKEMEGRVTNKIEVVLSAVSEVKQQITVAEEHISAAEDKINQLETHAKSLESYVEILQMKVDELEYRSRIDIPQTNRPP